MSTVTSNSTHVPILGFNAFGRKIIYEEYTSLPLTTIFFDQPTSTMAEEDFHHLDFTLHTPREVYPLKDVSFISVDDLLKVKDNIEPVLNLDLSAAGSAGMVPKAFPGSKPDPDHDPLRVSSFIEAHECLDTRTLVNIHYAFRLHALLYKINKIRRLNNGTMKFNDERINALVHHEAATAFDSEWHDVQIFANDEQMGLVHRLWADAGVSHDLLEGRTPTAAIRAVLLSYVPHWMAGEDVLMNLGATMGSVDSNAPTWFGGLRAACQRTNVQHLAIYTGMHLVVATFNAKFDAIVISQPMAVYCGQNVGYGVDEETGWPRASFSSMPVCLVPKSAEPEPETPVAARTSSQAPIQSLPFPLAGYIAPSTVPPWPPAPTKKRASSAKQSNRKKGYPYTREPSTNKSSSRRGPPPSVLPKRIPSAPGYNPSGMVFLGSKRAFDDSDLNKEPSLPLVSRPGQEGPSIKRRKLDTQIRDSLIQRAQRFRDEDAARRRRLIRERNREKAAAFDTSIFKEVAAAAAKAIASWTVTAASLVNIATRPHTQAPGTAASPISTSGVHTSREKKLDAVAKSLNKARICGTLKMVKCVGTSIITGARHFAKAVAKMTDSRTGVDDDETDDETTVRSDSDGNASYARQRSGEKILGLVETN
ncbi:hypothetical protein FRB94_005145 [Tulasnella sp. JGI-2019a]|nr:hypothetical protein FRB94_005145 [Tulasnella sp. JGI-2019a]